MLFKAELIEKILAGEKTQTRQPFKPGQVCWANGYMDKPIEITDVRLVREEPYSTRKIWEVGKSYAVCPGRGKRSIWYYPGKERVMMLDDRAPNGKPYNDAELQAIGYVQLRICITAIKREDARSISADDARAEGFDGPREFLKVWCGFYDRIAQWDLPPRFGTRRELISWQFVMEQLNARPAKLYDAWCLTFKVAT